MYRRKTRLAVGSRVRGCRHLAKSLFRCNPLAFYSSKNLAELDKQTECRVDRGKNKNTNNFHTRTENRKALGGRTVAWRAIYFVSHKHRNKCANVDHVSYYFFIIYSHPVTVSGHKIHFFCYAFWQNRKKQIQHAS